MSPLDPVPPRRAFATLLGVIAVILWSSTIAFIGRISEDLGTFSGGAVVYLTAGLIGLATLWAQGRVKSVLARCDRRYLFLCGGLMAVYTLLLYLAMDGVATKPEIIAVTVGNYLWPSLTLALSVPILGKRARPVLLAVGSLLALVGVALASAWGGSGGVVGASSLPSVLRVVAPALLAALAWGLYSNLSRLWGTAAPVGAMTFFLLASGLALLGARCFVRETSTISLRVVLEVAYMAVFPTLLAYTFWDTAARLGSLSLVASFGYLTPVLSIAVSAFYLAVPVAGVQWAAGALVVVGAVLSRASVREGASANKDAKTEAKTDADTDAKTDAKRL